MASLKEKTARFLRILREELEFEDASEIASTEIEELFENPDVGPFLTEFISSVTKENFVSDEALESYQQLQDQGKVKYDSDLQRNLKKLAKDKADYVQKKADIDANLVKLRQKKERLNCDIEHLKNQKVYEKLDELKKTPSVPLQDEKYRCESSQVKVSKALDELILTFNKLCDIIEGDNFLLSQVSLKSLLQAEENYNNHLTSFVKKQFFDAREFVDGKLFKSELKHEVKSIGDVNLLMGQSKEIRDEIAADVKRAEIGYSYRERSHISSKAKAAAEEAKLSFLTKKLNTVENGSLSSAYEDLRLNLEKTMMRTEEVQNQVDMISNQEIPNLISQSTPLQTTFLLTGDYKRTQARQQYWIEKQVKVISLLITQSARLDLLWMLLDVEEAEHKQTGKQIPLLVNQLRSNLQESVDELQRFKLEESTQPSSKPHSFIDGRDKVSIKLHEMLVSDQDNHQDKQPASLLQQFSSLQTTTEELRKKLSEIHSNIVSHHEHENAVAQLSSALTGCENLLQTPNYDGSGDQRQVMLTPEAVQHMSSHLQGEFNRLPELIRSNTTEINRKKSYLEYSKKASFIRNLWTTFFLSPDEVKMKVEEFSAQIE